MVKRLIATIVVTVMLSGCARSTVDEYGLPPNIGTPLSASTQRLEQCQALVEERQRYGIVASPRTEDALQRCGFSYGGSRGQPQATPYVRPSSNAPNSASAAITATPQDEVHLQLYNGVFAVPVVINRAVSIPFVLDSGASEVQLPAEVVLTLMRSGTLSEADFIGASSYVLANGSTLRSPRFNIRDMRVGEHVVRNVAASVGPVVSSDALLGQSFLSKLPSWTLDNKRHVLILAR
jgi:predicted aspartyl protease